MAVMGLRRLIEDEKVKVFLALLISVFAIPTSAAIAFALRLIYDDYKYPHDGQSGLDAIAFGLIVGVVAIPCSFFVFKACLRILRSRLVSN